MAAGRAGKGYVSRKALRDYLVGSLYWSGLALDDPGRLLTRAARWYAALVGLGYERVPFAVVLDLGVLLDHGPRVALGVSEWFERYPPEERAFRVAYGNGFLASLVERAWFTRAHDVVSAAEDRDPAVLFALERILAGAEGPEDGDMVVQPSRFPQIAWDRIASDVREHGPLATYRGGREAFEAWMDAPGFHRGRLEAFLEGARMRGGARPMGELDFFELENLSLLDTREKRLSARQLKQAELLLPPPPAGSLMRVAEVEEVEVDAVDEGTYPSGGLEGMANRGTWENLLPTELAYMEDDAEIDLFTVRFVEGELLFYTRDGGHLRRRRRAVHVVLDLDEGFEVKFPEHPFRLDRMVEGLATRLVADVLEAFEKDACTVSLRVLGTDSRRRAEMLALRFGAAVRRGEVAIAPAEGVDLGELCDPRRKSYAVWIGRDPPLDPAARLALEQDRMAAFAVQVEAEPGPEDPAWLRRIPVDGGLVEELRVTRDHLLEAILGAG